MREAVPLDQPQTPASAAAGASRPYAQPPDQETNPALDTAYPQRLHGILFISFGSQNGSCSATVVSSRNRSVILTAGHCVVQPAIEGGVSPPIWAGNVMFVPGYRNGARPLGTYVGAKLARVVRVGRFRRPHRRRRGDHSAPRWPASRSRTRSARAGSASTDPFDTYKKNKTRFQVFGYPAQPSAFYDGERLILCDSPFIGFQVIFTGAGGALQHEGGLERRRLGAEGRPRQLGRQPQRLRHRRPPAPPSPAPTSATPPSSSGARPAAASPRAARSG